ncbi:hypothetical protein U4E84_05520 [Halorubrum sp. AD140]|uniref:hypothetical protein n=1 Tax=Halorubrum sp. AD140 TaxID=3050073 RepID=UPI002ACC8B59|nr:hypothetical protein [Halorubrum sp. AD140]MDZ5810803.1 hypothetical protein [Halorubrum sp. AD140]
MESAQFWIVLVAVFGSICGAAVVWQFTTADRLSYRAFAGVWVAIAGLFELGMANGYLPQSRFFSISSGLSTVIAIGLVLPWLWRVNPERTNHGTDAQ